MIYNSCYKKTLTKDGYVPKSPLCEVEKTVSLILGLIYFELVLTDIFVLVRTASVCFRFFFPRNPPPRNFKCKRTYN